MIVELAKKCFNKCSFIKIMNTGELRLNKRGCKSCVFNFERVVCCGENNGKILTENEFKKFYDYLKNENYVIINNGVKDEFFIRKDKNKKDEISFLNFCVKNNIYKDWCVKVLKKKLNEQFDRKH